MNKKIKIYAAFGVFIAAGLAATKPPKEEPGCRNCKVIPKNIDEEQMERVMHKITHDIGVTCSYCHPDTKPGILPVEVDFVTDEIPQKGIARKMMIMTDKLNKKYFNYTNDYGFESLKGNRITCNTCHRGLSKPVNIPVL